MKGSPPFLGSAPTTEGTADGVTQGFGCKWSKWRCGW
ncbi:hypothetical protein ES332_A04G043700v1 [Gossypium tomentosum]|uniref:Uncharacterized protein n=1 Tax=Gossypium tomentosum TaxID=34277 RepID=A0A5D2QUW5_GOSTO|nr:hypothetical protein ES332_A04G043700v1 [Gossypium tomentosum]